MYEPRPTKKFCHAESRSPSAMQAPNLKSVLLAKLLQGAQESALEVHLSGLRALGSSLGEPPCEPLHDPLEVMSLVMSTNAQLQTSLLAVPELLGQFSQEQQQFYNQHVCVTAEKATAICLSTVNQVGENWHKHRKLRITGSRAYEIYTYNRPTPAARNWPKKLEGLVFSTFKGNADTTYGLNHEEVAIQAYSRQTNKVVKKFGLIVNANSPWLGYSPDGIVVCERRLIEVKCLAVGKVYGGLELARNAGCVNVDGNTVTLKKKHKYFGQVQLGLMTAGLEICDFLLYSKALDEVLIVEVPYDPIFCGEYINSLREVYFKIILPFLVQNKEQLALDG